MYVFIYLFKRVLYACLCVVDSYDDKEVKLVWDDNTPIETHDLNLPQFSIVEDYPTAEECKEAYKTGRRTVVILGNTQSTYARKSEILTL